MAAHNEHEVVSGKRLGRRQPSNKPALRLANFLTGQIPAHSDAVDHFSLVRDWGLYKNDEFGVCGPTSAANSRKLITKYLTGNEQSPTQDDVFDLYRRSGNPNFDPRTDADDNGVDMQTMCEALVSGGIGGTKALGFAKVDVSDVEELEAAIDIFGFLLLGVDLDTAQQNQVGVWDYVPSPEWGGHAILTGRYAKSDQLEVVSWAELYGMTEPFMKHQLGEAWAVIWPEHMTDNGFRKGVDLQAFASAYHDITGRPFPADIPPAPAPSPSPAPTPTPVPPMPEPTPGPTPEGSLTVTINDQRVIDHVQKKANSKNQSADEWIEHELKAVFHIKG